MRHGVDGFKVVFFLPQLGGGGAEMNAVRLAPGLLEAGIRPVYAVTRGPGSYTEFLPDGAEVVVLDTGSVNSSILRLWRARKPLAHLIDRCKPDVLCPVMAVPSVAALSAVRRAQHQPAVVLSIQVALGISHELSHSRFLRRRLELVLIRRFFPRCDGAIALSEGVAAELREIVPSIADRIKVIHNVGMPLRSQVPEVSELPRAAQSRDCTLLACGRLTPQKDYPTLFRSFAQLKGNGQIRLNILGDGELRAQLEAMARELGISERVRFLGFRHDPYSHMRRADIFILSSLWEGFGNVLVEAMAMGTPVVATDCPHGPSEIISHGVNGLLVHPGDPSSLAGAVQQLIDDPHMRQRIAEAGERRASDFAAETIGGEYARFFREIAEEKTTEWRRN